MYSGSVTLNGITDQDLVRILEVKVKHEKNLHFNPQQMQTQAPPNQPQFYNNIVLTWNDENGLEAVHQIIAILMKK